MSHNSSYKDNKVIICIIFMARILVFGDSITAGALDYEEGGWVNRLRKFLDLKVLVDRKFSYRVYNLGISGDTTEDLIERFEFETKTRLKEPEENIIILEIGINDSLLFQDKGELSVSAEKTKKNIQKLIKLSRKFTEKFLFIGLSPVYEPKVNPLPWRKEVSYRNEYIRKYNEIIKSVCKEKNVKFVEILEEWIRTDYNRFLEDGVHPNSEGHEKIFEIVKNFLIEKKII